MKIVALLGSAAFAGAVSLMSFSPASPGVVVKPNPYPTCPPPIVQAHPGRDTSQLHYCPQ